MTPDQVRKKWPREVELAEQELQQSGSALKAISFMRKETGISLPDAKRVILAVQCATSLEEHEEKLIPSVEKALEALDEDDRK